MFALFQALTLPVLLIQPMRHELGTRWHSDSHIGRRQATTIGERMIGGWTAALCPDQIWSLIADTTSGKVIEMRLGTMGWGRYEVTMGPGPIRAIRAFDLGFPGPPPLFNIDGKGETTNWFIGSSGR